MLPPDRSASKVGKGALRQRNANRKRPLMMVTGGTSRKRIPQFNDVAAFFDCAAATVLHMAHPWASSSGALKSTTARAPAARMHHCFLHRCFIGIKGLSGPVSEHTS